MHILHMIFTSTRPIRASSLFVHCKHIVPGSIENVVFFYFLRLSLTPLKDNRAKIRGHSLAKPSTSLVGVSATHFIPVTFIKFFLLHHRTVFPVLLVSRRGSVERHIVLLWEQEISGLV